MEGGAWQSGVHDNGRDFGKEKAPSSGNVEEARTVPAMYNPSPVSMMSNESRSCGTLILLLRGALMVFSLIAFALMVSNRDKFYTAYTGVYYTNYYENTLKFSAIKSFVGLLSLDIIVTVYAIVQLVLCFLQNSRTGAFVSSPTAGGSLLTFFADTGLAYALIGAGGAAADSRWTWADEGYCGSVPAFCRKGAFSIAMSFLAFAILATTAALYPIRLLRLFK